MAATETLPFNKDLASSDTKTRRRGVTALHTHLTHCTSLSPLEAQKLWKTLYYALWMTDKPLHQQGMAVDMAAMGHDLPSRCVVAWYLGFWTVMSAQWTEIDALRMDKFLKLVREVFGAQVRCVKDRKYAMTQDEVVSQLMEQVFEGYCFEREGDLRKVPLGLRLHVLDVWVDQLEAHKVLDTDEGAEFVKRIGEAVDRLRKSPIKSVKARAEESYSDERLPWVEEEQDECENEDEDDEWGGIED